MSQVVSRERKPLFGFFHSLKTAFKSKKRTAPAPLISSAEPALPIELLEQIVSLVRGNEELLQLSQTCRALNYIASKRLYRTVAIDANMFHGRRHPFTILPKVLSSPQKAELVTTLNIFVPSIVKCKTRFRSRTCVCAEWDEMFGTMAMSLPNLQDLRILQFNPKARVTEYPSYLARLSTTQLRRFRFLCGYDAWQQIPDFKRVLLEPSMQSLEVLCLPFDCLFETEQEADDFFSNPDVLPNLTTIIEDGNMRMPNVFVHRKIRRVLLGEFRGMQGPLGMTRLFQQLLDSKTKLTHLSTMFSSEIPFDLVVANLELFTDLQHLGRIRINNHNHNHSLDTIMQQLARFPNLYSISVEPQSPKIHERAIFEEVRVRLPRVTQILHIGTRWRLNEAGEWKPESTIDEAYLEMDLDSL
ncbi:hypothetical protein FRC17_002937 [Serendipita sp. 399]|nr:hypothetical protein FRC17_002937 [Serendipita sp. 399]